MPAPEDDGGSLSGDPGETGRPLLSDSRRGCAARNLLTLWKKCKLAKFNKEGRQGAGGVWLGAGEQ